MTVGLAELSFKKLVLDLDDYGGNDIVFSLSLKITNMHEDTLYYKLVSSDSNYLVNGGTEKDLGGVNPDETKYFYVTLTRPNPGSPLDETLTLLLRAYTDPDYTTLFDELTINIPIVIDAIENTLPNIEKYTFQVDTEGWSLEGISDSSTYHARSYGRTTDFDYEGSGGSLYALVASEYNYMSNYLRASKEITVPGSTKSYLKFVFGHGFKCLANCDYGSTGILEGISVHVDNDLIWSLDLHRKRSISGVWDEPVIFYWSKAVVDLSKYVGQTVTLSIQIRIGAWGGSYHYHRHYALLDHIVIAGD